ncbi:MAG: hypothetical protein M0Z55_08810 [Peptococcaceae bacterium]|nr:hypothetical protein [Peptococcaceae bacterium]
MKKKVFLAVLVLPALLLAGCGASSNGTSASTASPSSPSPTTTSTVSTTAASNSATKASFTMTMETGKMDGKPGWPKFVPGNLTLPANADVTLTINSYDDGNAGIPTGDNKVTGTVGGSMTLDGKSVTSIPTKDVAHTITISSLGLNVPIAVKTASEKYSVTTFTFHTPSTPTVLNWQCEAACGSGKDGWEGAMSTDNWMKGTFNVVNNFYTMTMETGKMDGKPGWPQFVPANLTLPKNQDVTIAIESYDDGNAGIPAGDNKVTGTVGGSMALDGNTVTSIPTNNVAHTITISSIGLNVPIAVKTASEKYSTTEFTFHTPSTPTALTWQCEAACGSGKDGWEGAMITNGWMKGIFNIQ